MNWLSVRRILSTLKSEGMLSGYKNNNLHTFNNTMVNNIVKLPLMIPILTRLKLNCNSDYRQIDGS